MSAAAAKVRKVTAPDHWAIAHAKELRRRASELERHGGTAGVELAGVYNKLAAEIEQLHAAWEDEQLTNAQGALESGFTADRLRQMRNGGLWSGMRKDLPRHATGPAKLTLTRSRTDDVPSIAERRMSRQRGGGSHSAGARHP